MSEELENYNRLVLRRIAALEAPSVLGFLPITSEEQDAILRSVSEVVAGRVPQLRACLERVAPAATAFSLAIAASRAMRGRDFYSSWERELQVSVPGSDRPDLAHRFERTCRSLGLVVGAADVAWVHARWFIFQAGIVPHWVEPLVGGIKSTIKYQPVPDISDDDQIHRFAVELTQHIFHQTHLKEALETELGVLLCRRMLLAQRANDYSLLPPHLSDQIREAFQSGISRVHLRSPYLGFHADLGTLFWRLPRQSSRLANESTHWVLDGRRYSARVDREIPVSDFDGDFVDVQIKSLEGDLNEQSFRLPASLTENHPFLIFKANEGKLVRLDYTGSSINLAPGDYSVVYGDDVDCDEDDCSQASGLRRLSVEIFPGRDALNLRSGDREWSIKASLHPGIFIDASASQRLRISGEDRVYYGQIPRFQPYIPTSDLEDDEILQIEVSGGDSRDAVQRSIDRDLLQEQDPFSYVSFVNDTVDEFCRTRSPGLNEISVSVTWSKRSVQCSIFFWQGLNGISVDSGFHCSEAPGNLDWNRSRGVKLDGSNVRWVEDYQAADVLLATRDGKEFHVPRPGVYCRLCDPDEAWEEAVSHGSHLDLMGDERRILTFSCGGFEEWEIICQGVRLAVLSDGKPSHLLTLAGLSGQFGAGGDVVARSTAGRVISLFSFVRPLIASKPKLSAKPGESRELAEFRLAKEAVGSIGVRVGNFLSSADEKSEIEELILSKRSRGVTCGLASGIAILEKVISTDHDAYQFNLNPGLRVRIVDSGDHYDVLVTARIDKLEGGILFVDFFFRDEGAKQWQPLACAENHGVSLLRLVFEPSRLEAAEPDDPWAQLVFHARVHRQHQIDAVEPKLREIPAAQLRELLSRTRSALAFKYPSTVWHRRLEWIQDIPVILAESCFNLWDDSSSAWGKEAAQELAEVSASKNAAVTQQLLIGSQPKLLRAPSQVFLDDAAGASLVQRCFSEAARVESTDSLATYTCESYFENRVWTEVFHHFDNFTRVSSGEEAELRGFKFGEFTRLATKELIAFDEAGEPWDGNALLSPGHLFQSIRHLNRRSRGFDAISDQDDPNRPLVKMLQTIERVHHDVSIVAAGLRSGLGFPGGTEIRWTHMIFEGTWGQRVADILFVAAAIGRLAAVEGMSVAQFENQICRLLGCTRADQETLRNRLCIVLSLAPELYTFYHLLWQVIIKASH